MSRDEHSVEQSQSSEAPASRIAMLALLGVPVAMIAVGLALLLPALMRGDPPAPAPLTKAQPSNAGPATAKSTPAAADTGAPDARDGPLSRETAVRMVTPQKPWLSIPADTVLTRLGFGSCLDQRNPQPIWSTIAKTRPQLFLMMGDNVYGDVKSPDARELVEAYRRQLAHPEFAPARATIPMLGIWDDHDYGLNDGGAAFPHRERVTELFRAYWQMPEIQARPDGIYYSRTFGAEGRRVQIIMLDTRSSRSALSPKPAGSALPGRYGSEPDPSRTMLGAAQWAWLEAELRKPADVRLLVSSIQVLSDGHAFERWGALAAERERLMATITRTGAKGVLILSGDRHIGAIYNRPIGPGQLLIEITSSSLNKSYGPAKDVRTPELISDLHHAENFGVIDVDWAARRVTLSLRGVGGEELDGLSVKLADLGHAE